MWIVFIILKQKVEMNRNESGTMLTTFQYFQTWNEQVQEFYFCTKIWDVTKSVHKFEMMVCWTSITRRMQLMPFPTLFIYSFSYVIGFGFMLLVNALICCTRITQWPFIKYQHVRFRCLLSASLLLDDDSLQTGVAVHTIPPEINSFWRKKKENNKFLQFDFEIFFTATERH